MPTTLLLAPKIFRSSGSSDHSSTVHSRIYVPVGWQIYARHGKASGRTFFSDKPTVVFNDRRE